MHILYVHTYTYIYSHILTSANCSQEVFWRVGGRRPRASGWAPTDQICCDRPRDWIVVRGSCIGDLPAANGRDASGAVDACRGVGCAKSGPSNICQVPKKWMLRCPGVP